jgi:hypothetical protein
MGQARSHMTDFLIDCYFNGFCKGGESQLRAMRHSEEATHFCEFLCEFATKCKTILTR